MLGYWKFDGSYGDSSQDGVTGYSPTGTTFAAGVPSARFSPNPNLINFGQSISFADTNSHISSFSNSTNLAPLDAVTFSVWIHPDQAPTATYWTIGGNYNIATNLMGFSFSLNESTIKFMVGNGSTGAVAQYPNSTSDVQAGSWTLLTGTWDGFTVKLYVNGTLRHSATLTGLISYDTTSFQLGHFPGRLDDVRVYDRALTQTEISELANGLHTSTTWTGAGMVSTYDWPLNWANEAVPEPFSRVTIPNTAVQPVLTNNERVSGLTIQSGATLDLLAFNMAFADHATFSNEGTLKLTNLPVQSLGNFTNDTNSGTIWINSTTSTSLNKTGSEYFNLTISGTPVLLLGNDIIVNGDLTLRDAGIFNAGPYNIILRGDWANLGGTFQPGYGTVTLQGTNQRIKGSNTFNNLTKSISSAATLTFDSGSTQTITNALTLQGANPNLLALRSSTEGTQWRIDPQGTRDVSSLDIKDSNNISATAITLTGHNTNSGNNTNWVFDTTAPTITINPVAAYTGNATQPVTGTATDANVKIASVNFQMDTIGGTWQSCTPADGSFDSSPESFICTPASTLSDGLHTMYIRATDTLANIVSAVNASSVSFTVDTVKPEISAVTALPGTTTASFVWTSSESASTIVDYGRTSSFSATYETDTATRVTSHKASLSGLAACTTYYYRVRSADAAGNTSTGSTATFMTSGCCAKPGEPDLQDATAKDTDSISLDFDKASGTVDHYELEYGLKSGDYEWEDNDIGDSSTDEYTVNELKADTTYYFRVRASNSCGDGSWSDEVSAKTKAAAATTSDTNTGSDSSSGSTTSNTSAPDPTPTATTTSSTTTTDTTSSSTFPGALTTELVKPNHNGDTSLEWQTRYFTNPYCYDAAVCGADADPDHDGITNKDEFRFQTDPMKADSDGDGFADSTEVENGRDPVKPANSAGGDHIEYESAKEKGEVNKDHFEVKDIEVVDEGDGRKKLKITGKGKPNSYLTVYVYSVIPTVLTVKTDEQGNWSYVLEKELEDGEHQVFVAVTDNTGKISEKSEPLSFIKTAGAVTVIPPAEATSTGASSVKKRSSRDLMMIITLGVLGLIVSLATIGLIVQKNRKNADHSNSLTS